ncbi:MAG: Small GTP-binding domain protein [Promethearchaeota archaeon]|jgi:small GTP-binding protein|nr:MAG: Small GTP-binding domain protein [Candidatus Lokiarchaeota archaeon]
MGKKFILKLLTAGEGGVGKTTLLHRYVEGKFSQSTKMTIGVEFFLKEVEVDGQQCTLQLWDFGGQERFRFLLESYVLGAKGALLMFDLTRIQTLENLEQWVNIVRKGDPNLPILFVGTKLDLEDEIMVQDDYAKSFLEELNLFDYIKISSKTGHNVQESFELLTKRILERQQP